MQNKETLNKNLKFKTIEDKKAMSAAAKLVDRSDTSFILIAIKEKIERDKNEK